jgi:hypothetical protein
LFPTFVYIVLMLFTYFFDINIELFYTPRKESGVAKPC